MGHAVIRVVHGGMLTTIQDAGRFGYRQWGVTVGGVMDRDAYRLANRLVGNDEGEGVIEWTQWGGEVELPAGVCCGLVGAELDPQWYVEGVGTFAFPSGRAVQIRQAGRLRFRSASFGCRVYMAIAGGVRVPRVMGSVSTDVRGRFGGYLGRPLRAGDEIAWGEERESGSALGRVAGGERPGSGLVYGNTKLESPSLRRERELVGGAVVIRMVRGDHWEWLEEDSAKGLLTRRWKVGRDADRMGLRLEGEPLRFRHREELASAGVVMGTLQVPWDGLPIVLGADAAPTGGYPRIGHVISADRSILGQLRVGMELCFEVVSPESAVVLWLEHEACFERLWRSWKRLDRET